MTNDIKQAAEAIVEKYIELQPYLIRQYKDPSVELAIQCAITEVEAIIKDNKANGTYEMFMQKWYDILEHLKQM